MTRDTTGVHHFLSEVFHQFGKLQVSGPALALNLIGRGKKTTKNALHGPDEKCAGLGYTTRIVIKYNTPGTKRATSRSWHASFDYFLRGVPQLRRFCTELH